VLCWKALSHEVTELKSEKMKVQSGLVTSSDADSRLGTATKERDQLSAEKKVNSPSQVTVLISC